MMKNYKLSRSGKVLEAVVKVLVAGIRDVVLEAIFVYCLDYEDLEALNLTEGVDWEVERLNAIRKRLSERLCKRLVGRLYKRFIVKLFRRVCEQIYALRAGLPE
ncbi:hypothetical protein Tco_1286874 [Tanacetum coccineum]